MRFSLLLFIACIANAGCSLAPQDSECADIAVQTQASLKVMSSPLDTLDLDQLYRSVAERVSGFGGAFTDKDGRLNVFLMEPTTEAAERARTELGRIHGEELAKADVIAVQGQYDYIQLNDWRVLARDVVWQFPETSSLGIQNDKNRIQVGIKNLDARSKVEAALTAAGVTNEAVLYVQREINSLLPRC